ncbi:patatin-like phospholipase family protein [Gammaproteobacteria bacterium AB-CW1]|uniref:Patatin-like phospholipase family protein n=1 Tax=Natronospira elongata TaxID=3110268 RepID=A0AAP6JE51_9GAMM|nr:patatin-like phospholipase family protein [Gammaproteobacteria bacterium AB-CW1]
MTNKSRSGYLLTGGLPPLTTLMTSCLLLVMLILGVVPRSALAEDSDSANEAEGERPKIALVLSGGGARGGAHLGVIRVLEEYQVPVDLIVGTSGGAIIGGLYASGWGPEEIEQWLADMDWDVALSDRLPRRDLPWREKENDERFLFDLQIGLTDGGLRLPRALIEGRNLSFILEKATLRSAALRDFDELPIPFRAVAADLEKAEKVVINRGRLSQAIRASMSVPGVFAPVTIEDRLLVDGGLVENLPVETALDLGADIIIAVNVSGRLDERQRLDDIFAISGQVTTLIVHRTVQSSLDLLESQDVLIEPQVVDIGPQAFHRTVEAAEVGEEAARAVSAGLQALSLPDSDYGRWQARQRLPVRELGELKELEFVGMRQLSERRLRALVESSLGEPLSLDRLQSDLGRLQRLGEIESVDFQVAELDEGVRLRIDVQEHERGPHHLRAGLEVFDPFDGDARYNLRLGHRLPGLNRLGGELLSELQLGHTRALRTEFHQPFSARGYQFLSLLGHHQATTIPAWEAGSRVAELGLRESRVGVDFGQRIARDGELRLGAYRGRLSSEQRTGLQGPPGLERETGGLRLLIGWDRLDQAQWPSHGEALLLEMDRSLTGFGADQAFRRTALEYALYRHAGAHRFMLAGEWGQADAPLPFQQQFRLGGPLSLSGLGTDELRGDRIGSLRGVWFRRLGGNEIPTEGGGMYAGAGLSLGGAWQHGEGVSSSELFTGAKIFMGADTPLGPVLLGATHSEQSRRGFFLTLGLPLHRPRPNPTPW